MTSSSSRFVLALLANVVLASTACGAFSGDSDSSPTPPDTQVPPGETPGQDAGGVVGEGPKAKPVEGPTNPSELTDALGIFVTTAGSDSAAGTHDHPLATIQAGIDKAKTVGKRVYVCTGTFKEALTLADSISVIGGLDCTGSEWHTGTGRSRIEAPTSPAVRAKDIKTATRLEGLDVVAPNATAPSGSSIGLIADQATALTVARSSIVAGKGMKGDDGVEGIQLANAGTAQGASIPAAAQCTASVCPTAPSGQSKMPAGGAGGTNTCAGAPGHIAQSGGTGGSGGVYTSSKDSFAGSPPVQIRGKFTYYTGAFSNQNLSATSPAPGYTAAPGSDATDGPAAATTGAFSVDGYAAANGSNGGDGSTGFGGSGGEGLPPDAAIVNPNAYPEGTTVRGWGGGGGGAGGCPGLAGTAGKGGGASIAALLLDSPVTFDGSELNAGTGGDGGNGTFGSIPTVGGARGNPEIPGQNPTLVTAVGKAGGRGGAAGVSSNGGSGPSLGIAHKGAAPVISGGTKLTPGTGGAAIAARSRTDAVSSVTKTIPATPVGMSKDILPL